VQSRSGGLGRGNRCAPNKKAGSISFGSLDSDEVQLLGGLASAFGEIGMTISAGFTCTDGILICVDMQPTIEEETAHQKIQRRTVPGLCEYVITGSGTGSVMLRAADRLQEALSASQHLIGCQSGATKKVVFDEVCRRRLKEIHLYIASHFGVTDAYEKYLQWIIATDLFDSGLSLLHVSDTGEVESVVGAGIILGHGAAIACGFCRILWNAPLSISQMRVLATFALYEARETAPLGRSNFSYTVTPKTPQASAHDDAKLAEYVEEAMRFVLLDCRAKSIRQEDFQDRLRWLNRISQDIEVRTQGNLVDRSIIMETLRND
jgi:hypothetical protein